MTFTFLWPLLVVDVLAAALVLAIIIGSGRLRREADDNA